MKKKNNNIKHQFYNTKYCRDLASDVHKLSINQAFSLSHDEKQTLQNAKAALRVMSDLVDEIQKENKALEEENEKLLETTVKNEIETQQKETVKNYLIYDVVDMDPEDLRLTIYRTLDFKGHFLQEGTLTIKEIAREFLNKGNIDPNLMNDIALRSYKVCGENKYLKCGCVGCRALRFMILIAKLAGYEIKESQSVPGMLAFVESYFDE